MVHVPGKFRENTSMRFRVTVGKLNVTDGQTDRRTGGIAIYPGPSAPREITRNKYEQSVFDTRARMKKKTIFKFCIIGRSFKVLF